MYRVYLVDDDTVILDELRHNIVWLDNGFEVVGSSNTPAVALDEIINLQPELVVSDLKMEPFDGIALMQKLKELGLTPYFLMVSAYGSFENSRRFFLEGGYDYLLKPFEPEEVEMILGKLFERLSGKTVAASKSYNPAFGDLLIYLQENYHQKHSLESLGKQFSLSPNYICTLFSKHCDTTLTHHITALRMEVAKKELEKGQQPLKDIASQCGYPDYRYFNRVFKEYYGVPPRKYKETGGGT
ncbi:helix-turn-helix domain-containing protein [Bengtsoniella intestinalis]|uniref:response regulator transcription factor n=1 Tax=Bengtsoniella intestinalis TaxID=3073143 RepID=UPI00391F3E34